MIGLGIAGGLVGLVSSRCIFIWLKLISCWKRLLNLREK